MLALFAPLVAMPANVAVAQDDKLLEDFRSPRLAAKPRVWWHWNSGQISAAGIAADLDWMQRVGLGGYQAFDVDLGAPRDLPPPSGPAGLLMD